MLPMLRYNILQMLQLEELLNTIYDLNPRRYGSTSNILANFFFYTYVDVVSNT